MSKGNGQDQHGIMGFDGDAGMVAMRAAFHDAKYFNNLAKQCANLMMQGAHRQQNIPDAVIMECYGSITAGNSMELKFETDRGAGYLAKIESYADLLAFMKGTLKVMELGGKADV